MMRSDRLPIAFVAQVVALTISIATANAASVIVVQPGFAVVNEFELPAGLAPPLGDLVFSADGMTAYLLDASEDPNSAVWALPVTRGEDDTVTGFGAPGLLFADATMDSGLTYAPNGTTLFYRTYGNITQRRADGATEDAAIVGYTANYGGLAFVPAPYSNEGSLVVSSYDVGTFHLHSVTDDGDGTYTLSGGTLYADITSDIDTDSLGDLEFLGSGPLAGSLLAAAYGDVGLSVFSIPLDPTTGLPSGGSVPTVIPFASGTDTAWGIAIDPVTDNIWIVHYGDSTSDSIHLVQIAEGPGGDFVLNPDYSVITVFPLPAGLSRPLGDLMFSADGMTAFVIDQSEAPAASLWSLPVTRDPEGDVTAFGPASLQFTDAGMDTGITYAPGSSTLLYGAGSRIVQRLPGGTTEDKPLNNYSSLAGLAVTPEGYPNAGDIVTGGYADGKLFHHALTDDGDGSFTIADGTVFADLSATIGTGSIGDLEYLTSGSAAPSLLVAGWDNPSFSLFTIALDPTTGLPQEGSSPTLVAFAQGSSYAWGVTVDPVSRNLWLVNWLADEENGEAHLVQIAWQPLFADGFESGDLSGWGN